MPGSHVLGVYIPYRPTVCGNTGWQQWVVLALDMTAANRVHVTKVDNSGRQAAHVSVGWVG